jgi:hypothetical protein
MGIYRCKDQGWKGCGEVKKVEKVDVVGIIELKLLVIGYW